ncbi:MAG: hypothetical protein R3F55_25175 [Alphaproteobacteria bacterium]
MSLGSIGIVALGPRSRFGTAPRKRAHASLKFSQFDTALAVVDADQPRRRIAGILRFPGLLRAAPADREKVPSKNRFRPKKCPLQRRLK